MKKLKIWKRWSGNEKRDSFEERWVRIEDQWRIFDKIFNLNSKGENQKQVTEEFGKRGIANYDCLNKVQFGLQHFAKDKKKMVFVKNRDGWKMYGGELSEIFFKAMEMWRKGKEETKKKVRGELFYSMLCQDKLYLCV